MYRRTLVILTTLQCGFLVISMSRISLAEETADQKSPVNFEYSNSVDEYIKFTDFKSNDSQIIEPDLNYVGLEEIQGEINSSGGSSLINGIEQGINDFDLGVDGVLGEIEGVFGDIEGTLDDIEGFLNSTVGTISDTVGTISGIFNQVISPIQKIFSSAKEMAGVIVRLINFPSTIGGWWNQTLGSLSGDFDRCFSEFSPEKMLEPGWCFGGSVDENGITSGHSNESMDTTTRSSMGEILATARGPAGIPIPSKLSSLSSEAIVASGSDNIFEINPVVAAHYNNNTATRALTQVSANNLLGETGQQKMVEELKGISESVTSSFAAAKAAQGLDVTQDVMKQNTQIQATEVLLSGSIAASLQQMRVDNSISHLNLSNISRSLDQANRARRIDRTISNNKVISASKQLSLQ